jgi:hypothetical protein
MEIARRLEAFDKELDPAGPQAWTLAQLDFAREALLAGLSARRFHCGVAETQACLAKDPVGEDPPHRHWILTWLGPDLRKLSQAMTPAMEHCYLLLAKARLDAGDTDQAILTLERVLSQNPLHPEARALLKPLAGTTTAAKTLDVETRLCHVRSFGHTRLKLPVSALPLPGGRILVADHLNPALLIFSKYGRLERTLPLGLKMACILAEEDAGRYLICDRDNRRVVRFDLKGRVLAVLPVRLREGGGEMLPLRAFPIDGRLLVAAVNEAMDTLTLGEMTPEGFSPLRVFPRFPLSLHRLGECIAVRDFGNGRVELYDPRDGSLTPRPLDMPVLAGHNALAPAPGGGLFLDIQGTSLAKFDARGKLVYHFQVAKLFGPKTTILELRAFGAANDSGLLVVDTGNHCIRILDAAAGCDRPGRSTMECA